MIPTLREIKENEESLMLSARYLAHYLVYHWIHRSPYSNPKSVVRISIAETLWGGCALRAHTTRPIADCCSFIPWADRFKRDQINGTVGRSVSHCLGLS